MLRHRLVFLRHGETDWNAEGRLQGQQDIPLNAKGRRQAEKAGRIVARILGPDALSAPGFRFLCSPHDPRPPDHGDRPRRDGPARP